MFLRILLLFKQLIWTIGHILIRILRCGRRKKAEDNTPMTDIVIGDIPRTNQNYQNQLPNGYEVPTPTFYESAIASHQKYPYQNQNYNQGSARNELQMQPWDQWGEGDQSSVQVVGGNQPTTNLSPHQEDSDENINFFTDMEPSVKVKKFYVKKKQRLSSSGNTSDRLQVNTDLDFVTSSELDTWKDEDDTGTGWSADEDLDEIDAEKVAREAREQRRLERLRRSEEQKNQRHAKKSVQHATKLATKVS